MVEASRQRDREAVIELVKGFWEDKRATPLHRLYRLIASHWDPGSDGELAEALLHIRDAVFCALDMLSLSTALDTSTEELLALVTGSDSWEEGRRVARSHCSRAAAEMIAAGKTDHLVDSGLERDGFAYLVPPLRRARLEAFRRARPRVRTGRLGLGRLRKTTLGRELLRQQSVVEKTLPADDPRAQALMEAYELMLVELELEESQHAPEFDETQQVTLTGDTAPEEVDEAVSRSSADTRRRVTGGEQVQPEGGVGDQAPLTVFLEDEGTHSGRTDRAGPSKDSQRGPKPSGERVARKGKTRREAKTRARSGTRRRRERSETTAHTEGGNK